MTTQNMQTEHHEKPIHSLSASDEPEVHRTSETLSVADLRFVDPKVQEIVAMWRQRQDFHRAEKRLTLQVKAVLRRFCDGDKTEAEKLYRRVVKHEAEPEIILAIMPMLSARDGIEKARLDTEKVLRKLAMQLPIYPWVKEVRGFGELGLAATVGECGSLAAYRSVSAVWKRCGLAVIDGERQRRVAGDAAFEHGYSPSRRSVFWTLSDSMLKAQGKDENAGPYRQVYDARKAYEKERGVDRDIIAHSRAMRYMFKRFLRDLTVAWKAMERDPMTVETHSRSVPSIAAE